MSKASAAEPPSLRSTSPWSSMIAHAGGAPGSAGAIGMSIGIEIGPRGARAPNLFGCAPRRCRRRLPTFTASSESEHTD
jgi:hypothetical protein